MTDDNDGKIKAGDLGSQVADTIRHIREKRRLPYTELSERLTQLGRPIPVLGLRRIEKGERRVDVDELAALAEALEVPAVLLLFPIGQPGAEQVEILPGVSLPLEPALAWFIGDGEAFDDYFGGGSYNPDSRLYEWYEMPAGVRGAWSDDARPLWLYRQHRRYVQEWFLNWTRPRLAAGEGKPVGDFVFTLAALAEENLRNIRSEMRRLGLALPKLPPSSLRDRVDPKQGDDGGGQED